MKICLDPGHGGIDSGAVGPSGLHEADITIAVALKVAAILERSGVEVALTRQSNDVIWTQSAVVAESVDIEPESVNDDLAGRCNVANKSGADYFISIHCNSAGATAHGTETFCYKFGSQGEQLARAIQEQLIAALGLTDRGTKVANYYVLRRTNMPAALTELAFISNPDEEQLLVSDEWQDKAAKAVALGILNFLGIQLVEEVVDPSKVWVKIGDTVIEGALIDDRVYAPVRAIADALGYSTGWIPEKRTAVIYT